MTTDDRRTILYRRERVGGVVAERHEHGRSPRKIVSLTGCVCLTLPHSLLAAEDCRRFGRRGTLELEDRRFSEETIG